MVEFSESNPKLRVIVIPKEDAYREFSGAFTDEAGKPEVMYEADLFSCMPSNFISMNEEFGDSENPAEYQITQLTESSYQWFQDYGDGFDLTVEYFVEDDFFTKVKTNSQFVVIDYGPVSDADMQLLKTAVDAEYASR